MRLSYYAIYVYIYIYIILFVVWSGRVTNAEIRQRTNTKNIVVAAHSFKWQWGGHVARMDKRRWAHAASMWDIRVGKGRTGNLKTPWQTRYRE